MHTQLSSNFDALSFTWAFIFPPKSPMEAVNTLKSILCHEEERHSYGWFKDALCHLCLVFVMLLGLCIAALWSPAGKGLTSLALVCNV